MVEWYLIAVILMPGPEAYTVLKEQPFESEQACIEYTKEQIYKDFPWIRSIPNNMTSRLGCFPLMIESV